MREAELPWSRLPSSILLEAPGFGEADDDACAAILAATDPDAVVFVSYAGDPTERLERAREQGLEVATALAIVVGDGGAPDGGTFEAVERVSTPGDLTGLGIAVTEALEETRGTTALCLDSVTSLLQYVDVESAYEFLHVLTGRFYTHDATGHLHVDPGAHDDRTVARLASLVDGRVTVGEDGSLVAASGVGGPGED